MYSSNLSGKLVLGHNSTFVLEVEEIQEIWQEANKQINKKMQP